MSSRGTPATSRIGADVAHVLRDVPRLGTAGRPVDREAPEHWIDTCSDDLEGLGRDRGSDRHP